MDEDLAQSDLDTAMTASAQVIVSPLSHCYFDVPYAERPADLDQEERQARPGLAALRAANCR
jgi:hypothetical protein